MSEFIAGLCFGLLILFGYLDYRNAPHCRHCGWRHHGRCIYNPRSGRFLANVNDGHFDYNDPNK